MCIRDSPVDNNQLALSEDAEALVYVTTGSDIYTQSEAEQHGLNDSKPYPYLEQSISRELKGDTRVRVEIQDHYIIWIQPPQASQKMCIRDSLYRGDAVLMEQPGELTCGGARGDHIVEQCHMPVVVRFYFEGATQIASPLAGTEPGLLRGRPCLLYPSRCV